ncbi:MAG TPA: hypothetical protein VEH84_14735, partial [Alphaproteobacteria bacterium]|nr:hypothetical protein [Alphaproteobacteria bacterium]
MRTLIAAVGFTVSLGLAAAGMAQTKTIRIAYSDTESFPNQMGTTAVPADKPGVVVEMMQMAAKELGVELELTRLSNKRVLDGLKDGSIDGAISYSFSKERAEFAKYPMKGDAPDGERRVSTLTYIIYKAKGGGVNWDGKAFQNLDKAIGANSGYSVVGDLKKAGAEVEEANATDINFKKLV